MASVSFPVKISCKLHTLANVDTSKASLWMVYLAYSLFDSWTRCERVCPNDLPLTTIYIYTHYGRVISMEEKEHICGNLGHSVYRKTHHY